MPIPGLLAASLISGLAGLAGIGAQIGASSRQSRSIAAQQGRNIAAQMKLEHELADKRFKYDNLMVDKMNAYNAPKMQMERFKEAGLNPNLIYGQGTPGNQSQMAKYQQQSTDLSQQEAGLANVDYSPLGNLGNVVNNTIAQHQQIMNNKVQRDMMRAQADAAHAQGAKAAKEAGVLGNYMDKWQDKEYEAKIGDLQASASLKAKQIEELDAKIVDLGLTKRLKEAEAKLKEEGLDYTDPWWLRTMIIQGKNATEISKEAKDHQEDRNALEILYDYLPEQYK